MDGCCLAGALTFFHLLAGPTSSRIDASRETAKLSGLLLCGLGKFDVHFYFGPASILSSQTGIKWGAVTKVISQTGLVNAFSTASLPVTHAVKPDIGPAFLLMHSRSGQNAQFYRLSIGKCLASHT